MFHVQNEHSQVLGEFGELGRPFAEVDPHTERAERQDGRYASTTDLGIDLAVAFVEEFDCAESGLRGVLADRADRGRACLAVEQCCYPLSHKRHFVVAWFATEAVVHDARVGFAIPVGRRFEFVDGLRPSFARYFNGL